MYLLATLSMHNGSVAYAELVYVGRGVLLRPEAFSVSFLGSKLIGKPFSIDDFSPYSIT